MGFVEFIEFVELVEFIGFVGLKTLSGVGSPESSAEIQCSLDFQAR